MLKFAIRNVFRNKKRSLFTALSIFFAAAIVVLSEGWTRGTMDMFLRGFIRYQYGNVRVVNKNYLKRERFFPVDEVIDGSDALIPKIRSIAGVRKVEERIRFGMLLGNGDLSEAAIGMGLDLTNSDLDLAKRMKEGKLYSQGIYVGDGLAKKLKIHIGQPLLVATKTSEGGLNGIKLPVKGIFKFGVKLMDDRFFFLDLKDAKRLLKLKDTTTEIYVFTDQNKLTHAVRDKIQKLLPSGVVAQTFDEQMGSLYQLVQVSSGVMWFFEALILFLASFVIVNTMMMAIFERLQEIGTLKAIGYTDGELFVNFTLEGAIIGAIGGIPGALFGYLIVVVMSHTGFDMAPYMDNVDMPLESMIYPTASLIVLGTSMVLSLIIPALAAMWPARYAGKLTPAEALRK